MLGELNPQQVEDVLHGEVIARLGCLSDGRVYVVPVTYVYDGTYVWGHAMDGAKLKAMRAHPEVCVEVEHVDDMSNWRSVIAWG
ncbi:MAG: pyridoxamine 5'-phosphate oxidase family protein, partial [Mycobacterium sp.]